MEHLHADSGHLTQRWTQCSHIWVTTQYFGIDRPSSRADSATGWIHRFYMTSRIDTTAALGVDAIAKSILVLRHQNILLDRDLAALYGVTTKRLNEQVKRNLARFPTDFMFQLTAGEVAALRSHFATSKKPAANRGGRRYLPYAFTEQGVAMLSSVLSTEHAVAVNIEIMRAFVRGVS